MFDQSHGVLKSMSQYWFEGVSSHHGRLTVMVGWDEPLQWFHMYIGRGMYDENPLYSNMEELFPNLLDLDYFQRVLDFFGITEDSLKPNTTGLYEKLIRDKEKGE